MWNKRIAFVLLTLGLVAFSTSVKKVYASQTLQSDDLIKRGEYLASIAGCTFCHTPYLPEFNDPSSLTIDKLKTLAFEEKKALDSSKLMGGGRPFDLGAAGIVFSPNLTSDQDTGIGKWSDLEIKTALKTGLTPSGRMLLPIMPYGVFNTMADQDVDALVAYLRILRPVNNVIPLTTVATDNLEPLPYLSNIPLPNSNDPSALGEYLVKSVSGCTSCHTPIDPMTGFPINELFLGGEQPYEGPWGIVYGGNITPDYETGIGNWSENEIKTAIIQGVRPDGRRLILMPWEAYLSFTSGDLDAVTYYLKNILKPVHNQIPAASVNPEFVILLETNNIEKQSLGFPTGLVLLISIAVIVLAISVILFKNKRTNGKRS